MTIDTARTLKSGWEDLLLAPKAFNTDELKEITRTIKDIEDIIRQLR